MQWWMIFVLAKGYFIALTMIFHKMEMGETMELYFVQSIPVYGWVHTDQH